MFDDLFKTDEKSNINTKNNTAKSDGMFSDLFKEEKVKQEIPLAKTGDDISIETQFQKPVETPKKKSFLNRLKSQFFVSGFGGSMGNMFLSPETEEAIQREVVKPTLDMVFNKNKEIPVTYEKATRGSNILYANPKASFQATKDIVTGKASAKEYDSLMQKYYMEALDEWEKGGQDPTNSFVEKATRGLLDTSTQTAIGVLLNFVPIIGKGLSAAHFTTISAASQINDKGEVNSANELAIDVALDSVLGNTIEGMFKKPTKDLIKTGLVPVLKDMGKGTFVEGGTEVSQTFLKYGDRYLKAKTPEERNLIVQETKEYVKNGGMFLEFIIGGLSGAGISGLASMASQSKIDPNIPKPKLGISKDEDKNFTPEQNKAREAFREDIINDIVDSGMNNMYVARQLSKQTGLNSDISSLLVDEVSEDIDEDVIKKAKSNIEDAINKRDLLSISKQALNDQGVALEESKTPEVVEQPKLKIKPQEEALITEAKKYKSAEEFIKAQGTPVYHGGSKVLSPKDFRDAIKSSYADERGALFTSSDKQVSEMFGKQSTELYPKLKNPLIIDAKKNNYYEIPIPKELRNDFHSSMKTTDTDSLVEIAQERGHDGVIIKNVIEGAGEYDPADARNVIIGLKKDSFITKSQLEEIWNKAQEGEAKMKVRGETKKVTDQIDEYIKDKISNVVDLAYNFKDKQGKPDLDAIEMAEDLQDRIKGKVGPLSTEDRLDYNELVKRIDQEEYLPSNALDTLITKEDNKEYEYKRSTKNRKEVDERVQYNREGVGRGDVNKREPYKLDKDSRRKELYNSIRGKTRSGNVSTYRVIPKNATESEVAEIFINILPKTNDQTIDKLISYYFRIDEAGYKIILNRADSYKGQTNFDAFIEHSDINEYTLNVNNKDADKLSQETLDHEIGTHIYYPNTTNSRRIELFNGAKEVYKNKPKLFDNFDNYFQTQYWDMFVLRHLRFQIRNANNTITNTEEVNKILQDTGFLDENGEIIYPEDIMDATFNFNKLNEKLNKYLVSKGYNISPNTEEQNNMMGEEIIAYIAQEAKAFSKSGNKVIEDYSNDLLDDTLDFSKPEQTIGFDGDFNQIKYKLKESTNLTSDDILKKHADIELKRDINITDVYGNKAVLKQGEGITPYEMKGNKYILQDGEAYLVSKSQAENVMNNSKSGEAKPFAPELEKTEETIKGGTSLKFDDIKWTGSKDNLKGTLGDRKFGIQKEGDSWYVYEENAVLGNKAINYTDAVEKLERYLAKETPVTKYSSYTLPGGENYKEILIKAPTQEQLYSRNDIKEVVENQYGEWEVKLKDGTKFAYPDVATETEAKNQFQKDLDRGRISIKEKIVNKGIFKSSHWDEPNVISHIRMNERTYNGKKVAFMEELQSDWAREGRDKGFIGDNKVSPKLEAKNKLEAKGYTFEQDMSGEGYFVDNDGEIVEYDEMTTEVKRLMDIYISSAETFEDVKKSEGGVPYNQLLKNWQELAVKRALQEAVNENAGYFAWINGPQTATRYNLSKEVNEISWGQFNNGKNIIISPKDGRKIQVFTDENGKILDNVVGENMPNEWKGKNISEVIGKGIGEKIINSKTNGVIEGEGLNVGGEWAKNLYDKQVKAIVENLTGQKVEMLDMGLNISDKQPEWTEVFNGHDQDLTEDSNLKIGQEIHNESRETYIVVDVMGAGKFKAVPKNQFDPNGTIEKAINKKSLAELETGGVYMKDAVQTFDLSKKETQQMAIELTPSVKQIVKGEAPQLAKPSGKLPFAEQSYAPVMFSLRKPSLGIYDKSLVPVHNISQGKLAFALKIGALVNPSVAVIDINKQGFDNYGEISLIGNTDLLEQGKTFAADIYSPRFPSLTTKISNPEGYKILESRLKKYEDITDEKVWDIDTSDFSDSISKSSMAMMDFLNVNNIKIPELKGLSKWQTRDKLRETITEKGLEDKFATYIEDLKEEAGVTEHIFKGYTYSGNRKYVPATVENISKDMRSRGLTDSEGMNYGLGSLRAKIVQRLSSIKKIKEAKNRIVTTEEFEKARDQYQEKYSNLIDKFYDLRKVGNYSDNPFIARDDISIGMGEYMVGQFPQFLNNFENIPSNLLEDLNKFKEELKEMPTEYFESKFTRPVKLGEFSYAVIPDTISDQMISKLEGEGLTVVKYKSGNETDRLAKIKQIQAEQQETGNVFFSLRKPTLEELRKNLAQTQKALDKAVANPEVYGQNSIVNLNQKVADLRKQIIEAKYPTVDTGNRLEDARTVLKNIENRLGTTSAVNILSEKEAIVSLKKETLENDIMQEFEKYVADAGDFKGMLPEVTGKPIEELKKNKAFRGVKNENALKFAKEGDEIVKAVMYDFGKDYSTEEVREEFEKYTERKKVLKEEEKNLKQDRINFGKTDTIKIVGINKSLINEIAENRGVPLPIKEILEEVKADKKARSDAILTHKARPLMKYVDKRTGKLPKEGSKTAFGKSTEQILKDLGFFNIEEANKSIRDYISKKEEFVNPLSRMRMKERAAKFLREKQIIMEEVEKKIRAEGRDRKSKIEAIRDFFYMTDTEVRETIGNVDYRLVSEKEFETILKKLEEKSVELAEHLVEVSEVEWTIAQKELHRVENLQELMGMPSNLSELTIEQLNLLNETLQGFQHGDVFLGVREMETLLKNAKINAQTQREILEEVIGKRTGLSIEEIKKITASQMDKFRSAVSLSRQNAFYEIMVQDALAMKIDASVRYQEIENETNKLVKEARESRHRTLLQRLVPTDDIVILYLEEGDLETKQAIAKRMTPQELKLAHYIQNKYSEMRDYLVGQGQLDDYRENYVTHRARAFLEAWLRDGAVKSPKQFVGQFFNAIKETFFDIHKLDQAGFNITSEKDKEILPLEKFFKYSMRRSGQLIPTKNIAKAFLGYTNTFELKRALDKYIPRMEAVARALTPQETTKGDLLKDTTLENFVAQWINTQKGRPLSLKFINPGDTLDTILRGGVAFTRILDLALRIPAQAMSIVGEESATWINIGNKRYLIGQYRAKTAQGKKIAKKYESVVGKSFWDKMRDSSKTIENKLGETMFAFYGIAAKKANVHHLLGSLTEQEFKTGEISTERLAELKLEMSKWRADDVLSSVMGKTSIGGVFRQHRSWAIPIFTQTISNLQDIKQMVASGEYLKAANSKQFGELFRATMLTLILTLTMSKWYDDLKEKKDRNLQEELAYRGMNDAFSFLAALTPTTLFKSARLISWTDDMVTALTTVIGALASGEETAEGKTPGLAQLKKSFIPKLFSELIKESDQDKIMASISRFSYSSKQGIEEIKKEVLEPAQVAWSKVKELGVETDEASKVVEGLSDSEYEAYKLVKKADVDYWVEIAKKVTPKVQEAYKVGFGTKESSEIVENMTKDEYTMYKKVKQVLYAQEPTSEDKDVWNNQSFMEHISNLAKGWFTDPAVAFDNLIHGDWKITEIRNGQIIVNRMPFDASQKIREEAAKNNENYKLDHLVPIYGGGTNRASNLNIVTTEVWEQNTPVEVYLINKLKNKTITGEKLREYIIRYKVGTGQVPNEKILEEYKKKYNSTPITFQEIKNEIEGK